MCSGSNKTPPPAVVAGIDLCSLAIGHKPSYFSITNRASHSSHSLLDPLVPSQTSTGSRREAFKDSKKQVSPLSPVS